MKRKDYERPTMQVVEIQQQQLMTGSTSGNVNATMNNTWTEEEA